MGLKLATATLVGILALMSGLNGYVASVMWPLSEAESVTISYGPRRDIKVVVPPASFQQWIADAYPQRGEFCRVYCFRTVGMAIATGNEIYEASMCAIHGLTISTKEGPRLFHMPVEVHIACFTPGALRDFTLAPDLETTVALFSPEYIGQAEFVYSLIQSQLMHLGAPVNVRPRGPSSYVVEFDYMMFGDYLGHLAYLVDTAARTTKDISRARCPG